MKICIDCFVDIEIRSIIQTIDCKGNCNFCEITNNYVYDTHQHTELERPFNSLLERYTIKANLDQTFPSSLTVSIKSELKNNWNIFNKLEEAQIYNFLTALCSEKFKETPEFFDDLVGIAEFGNKDYINQNTLFYGESWDDFAKELKYETRFHSGKFNSDIFKKYLNFLAEPIEQGEKLYRGRQSDSHGYPACEMGSAPVEKAREGRANPRGIPYLYLAKDLKTVLYELRVTKNNYLTVAELKLIKPGIIIDLTKIGEISPFIFESEEMLTLHIVNRRNLEMIHDEIVKPASPYESYLDYLPTQYIFDFIRNNKSIFLEDAQKNRDKHQNIIGVKYKSSLHQGGTNYVFFQDELFDKEIVGVYKIKSIDYQEIKIG